MFEVSVGFEGMINYAVGGQDGGTFLPLTALKDCTLNQERTEIDVTTRASGGHEQIIPGIMKSSVDLELLNLPDDAGFEALREAFYARSVIGLQILDKADGHGFQADFVVTKFSRNEPLNADQTVSVTVKPTLTDVNPSYINPTSGT